MQTDADPPNDDGAPPWAAGGLASGSELSVSSFSMKRTLNKSSRKYDPKVDFEGYVAVGHVRRALVEKDVGVVTASRLQF